MMNELEQYKEDKAFSMFGRSRQLAIAAGQCVKCGTYDLNFRDDVSQKEFLLSGFCQTCQDEIFGILDGTEEEEV